MVYKKYRVKLLRQLVQQVTSGSFVLTVRLVAWMMVTVRACGLGSSCLLHDLCSTVVTTLASE